MEKKQSLFRRILMSAPVRIIIAVILLNVPVFIARSLTQWFFTEILNASEIVLETSVFLARVLSIYFIYYYFVKLMEKRDPTELKIDFTAIREFLHGSILAVLSISTVLLILYVTGGITIHSINSGEVILPNILYHFSFAFLQDMVFIAVLFRIIEESLGTMRAIVVASVIFGFQHLIYPGQTFLSAAFQTIEGGLAFCAFFILTRRIWMLVGFHFFWNFIQGGIVNSNQVGGNPSLFNTQFSGAQILTGDPVGLEASLITFILVTGVGIYYAVKAFRQNKFIVIKKPLQ